MHRNTKSSSTIFRHNAYTTIQVQAWQPRFEKINATYNSFPLLQAWRQQPWTIHVTYNQWSLPRDHPYSSANCPSSYLFSVNTFFLSHDQKVPSQDLTQNRTWCLLWYQLKFWYIRLICPIRMSRHLIWHKHAGKIKQYWKDKCNTGENWLGCFVFYRKCFG